MHCCLPSNSLGYFFIYFFLFAKILSRPYLWNHYCLRLQIECAAWSCGLILHCCLPSNSLRYFFFSATILSGPYLWNRYSQRLQIECAAWSCGLIVHYCLPSNSLCYLFFFFRHDFVRTISLEPLLAETPNWVCCLVLWSNCTLLLTIQFALLVFFLIFFFIFSAKILSGPYLWNRNSQRLQIECATWSCGLILHCCLPSNSLRYFIFFCHDFVRAISLEPLIAETPNWVCCLVLWFNFALLLTIQFALLISSLIYIISLLHTTFDWTKVRGIAPRSHTGRPRTCLVAHIASLWWCIFDIGRFISLGFINVQY